MLWVIEEKREERKNRKHKLCCCLWLFLCVFLFWLMTVCFCDWCCLLIVDGFDRQTEMSKCCVCCVLMVFFVSLFFFILWNELMNFVEDGKKRGKEKQESDWLQQKMFFVDCCWIDWLILFFWNGLKRKDFLIVFNLWINWF